MEQVHFLEEEERTAHFTEEDTDDSTQSFATFLEPTTETKDMKPLLEACTPCTFELDPNVHADMGRQLVQESLPSGNQIPQYNALQAFGKGLSNDLQPSPQKVQLTHVPALCSHNLHTSNPLEKRAYENVNHSERALEEKFSDKKELFQGGPTNIASDASREESPHFIFLQEARLNQRDTLGSVQLHTPFHRTGTSLLLDQIVGHIHIQKTQDSFQKTIRIELYPEQLGTLNVTMKVQDHQLHLRFGGEDPTLALLSHHATDLRTILNAQGFDLPPQNLSFHSRSDQNAQESIEFGEVFLEETPAQSDSVAPYENTTNTINILVGHARPLIQEVSFHV